MPRRYLSFIALAVSILYGAGFAAFDKVPQGYAAIGGGVVALTWIAVGVFGRDDGTGRNRERRRRDREA